MSNSENHVINKSLIWSEDLSDFLNALDSYHPTMPVECIQYYMQKAGAKIKDNRILKVVALAVDKFLCDTIYEAKQFGKIRNQKRTNKRKFSEISDTLNMEDLIKSLHHQNIHIIRKSGTLMGTD